MRGGAALAAGWAVRATVLVLCSAVALPAQSAANTSATADSITPARARAYTRCLANLESAARAARITRATWRRETDGLQPDLRVLRSLDAQPEFVLSIWDYLAATVDNERIADGEARLQRYASTLREVDARFGVDPATVVAVWGLESNFGMGLGGYNLVPSLATLSCEGRRQKYFRTELFAALRLVQAGHTPAEELKGSWAGAFGHVQFMPSTFERLAIDFDGDDRRDLMASIPDALASAANFLRNAGWRSGEPWGIEVRLPTVAGKPFNTRGEGRRTKRPLSTWVRRGLVRADGSPLVGGPLTGSTSAALLTPAGVDGPAFLVFRNYHAVYRYNAAESYTIAILHLADRLRGGGEFLTPWPTDDPGLSRADRRELQRLLIARGHDVGEVDGILGPRTRAGVKAEQERLGWEVDGRPGQKLLGALRGG